MYFKISLYISLAICSIGILYRVFTWFSLKTSSGENKLSPASRLIAFLKEFASVLFSKKIFLFLKVLFFDVLLQTRILKTSITRWIMHIFIFYGFILLTLMHAMDEIITQKLFPAYASTLNPFFFLRNLFGLMAIAGIGIAIIRRIKNRGPILETKSSDKIAIIIVAVIMVSGFLLDSIKIISEPVFNRMVDDYFIAENPEDVEYLKVYWAKEYGVVFNQLKLEMIASNFEKGSKLNDDYCGFCHSKPDAAFLAYPLAKLSRPVAVGLNNSRADIWLYWIHVIACFIMLAYLPFSKMFHLVTDPLTMLVNGVSDKKINNPSCVDARRAMEIDSCTNCGTCNKYCSVAPVFTVLENKQILPARKLEQIKALCSQGLNDTGKLEEISEGAFICSDCYRCTEVCPTGINLQDQWFNSREVLKSKGFPSPHEWVKEYKASEWADRIKNINISKNKYQDLSDNIEKFSACIQCQTCTNVCPVVAVNVSKENAIDITPQKVMNLLRMGMKDIAIGTRMAWDCTTCYQCQQNCPQGIPVTDILYELKNLAYESFKKAREDDQGK